MTELNRLSWETFTKTGNIDAYLLYKETNKHDGDKKEDTCQNSKQEVLS